MAGEQCNSPTKSVFVHCSTQALFVCCLWVTRKWRSSVNVQWLGLKRKQREYTDAMLSWNGALCLLPTVSLWIAVGQGGWNLHCLCSAGSGGAAKYQKCAFRSCPFTKFTSLLSRCATPLNKRQLEGFFFSFCTYRCGERDKENLFSKKKNAWGNVS